MAREWRQAVGFPDYEVSERGEVRRLTRGGRRYPVGYVLKAKSHQRGYLAYSLVSPQGAKDILAHRLVAMTWIGNSPSDDHEVAHADGSRTNNYWRNLRWATPAENQADRKAHGTYVDGERAYSARLSDKQVMAIRSEYQAEGRRYVGGSVTMTDLAEKHGVSPAQISRVVNRKQRTNIAD